MTLLVIFLVGITGLAASALFSGSEIGFYRATRLRLVLDALDGRRFARAMLWIVGHPQLFVTTILVGNNLANYVLSAAVVLATAMLLPGSELAEMIAPLLLTPVVFIYGELLPKHLFLGAPNRMLRAVAGPLLIVFILLAPITIGLWGLSVLLGRMLGERREKLRRMIARRELRGAVQEGEIAGLLLPVQTTLAQGIFAIARAPVTDCLETADGVPRAHGRMSRDEILALASRYRLPMVLVESPYAPGEFIGYYNVVELHMDRSSTPPAPRPMISILSNATLIEALTDLQEAEEHVAAVVTPEGKTLGIVTAHDLRESLWKHQSVEPTAMDPM